MVKARNIKRKKRANGGIKRTITTEQHIKHLKRSHKAHVGAIKWIWREAKKLGAPIAKALHNKAVDAADMIATAIKDM